MCKFLLTSSLTDVNCKDLHGNTPLHYAGVAGSTQLATLLVTSGAHALQTNKKRMLPLHSCVFSDHAVCFNYILKETEKQKMKAFQGKQVENAIDIKTYNGFTPLMLALEEKANNIFAYILQNGPDLKAQDDEGNSILHRAIML
jgi:ankyrin repeat protein